VYSQVDVDELAQQDKLDDVVWMYSKGLHISRQGWIDVLTSNAHQVCKWLFTPPRSATIHYDDVVRAVCANALDVLRILYPLFEFTNLHEQQTLEMSIGAGNIEMVRFIGGEIPGVSVPDSTFIHLVTHNNIDMVTLLWELGIHPPRLIEDALTHARHQLVCFLLAQDQRPSSTFLSVFLHDSNLAMIRVLLDKGFEFTPEHVRFALYRHNSTHTVLELMRSGAWGGDKREFVHLVVRMSKNEVLDAMWGQFEIDEEIADHAAVHASFGMIKMLSERGILPSKSALHEIVGLGHVSEVGLLLHLGMKPDLSCVHETIMHMHNSQNMNMLQLFLEHDLIEADSDLSILPKPVLRYLYNYQCSTCTNVTVNTCSLCNRGHYCNMECQDADRSRHQTFCDALANETLRFTELWN